MEGGAEHVGGGGDAPRDQAVGHAAAAHHRAEVDPALHGLRGFFRSHSLGLAHLGELFDELLHQRTGEIVERFKLAFRDAGFGAGVGNFSLGAQDDNPGDHLFSDRFGGGGDDAGILPLRQNDHFGAFAGAFFQRVQNRHFSILSV